MSKTQMIVGVVCFWIFLPTFLMYLNFAGFQEANIESLQSLRSNEFNFFTFSGLGTVIEFFFDLGKFTIQNAHPIILGVVAVLNVCSFIFLAFVVRGN
jgi:hypothetical protein